MNRYSVNVRTYRTALRDAVELSITTRGVLYVLAQWMDSDGTNARPRLSRLAASCQIRQRAIAKHLEQALTAGYLHRSSGGHRGQTAVYQAAIPGYRWDSKAGTLVQPLAVAEPPTRPRNGVGDAEKACTLKQERLHAEAGKAAPACSPTSSTTSVLPRDAFGVDGPSQAKGTSRSYDDQHDDPYEWIEEQVPDLTGDEFATVHGMFEREAHPHAVLNTVFAGRREVS